MNQRIHIHHDENDTPRRMIADYEREQAGDDEQSGLVVGVVIMLLAGFVFGVIAGLGLLIGGR